MILWIQFAELGNIPKGEQTPGLTCVSHPQIKPGAVHFYAWLQDPFLIFIEKTTQMQKDLYGSKDLLNNEPALLQVWRLEFINMIY